MTQPIKTEIMQGDDGILRRMYVVMLDDGRKIAVEKQLADAHRDGWERCVEIEVDRVRDAP